jgi:protein-export membrane protein SecD
MAEQMKQAQDLALVLRAGALPASVKVVEERQIGPTEGAQNIHAGVISTIVAAVLVVVVMLFIYGLSGLVANVAMVFNVLLILAFMALFGATLTLPGIAGIVLTMAIAVDGNVVINERIREEIRSGFNQKQAFYKGYTTSFRTLIDAHITSAVAGIVLMIYGNPTVKGFAVTLLCGIVCTLFTSYYVTEVIGQWLVERTKIKRFG